MEQSERGENEQTKRHKFILQSPLKKGSVTSRHGVLKGIDFVALLEVVEKAHCAHCGRNQLALEGLVEVFYGDSQVAVVGL